MKLILIAAALALAGCATTPGIATVNVPVPVECRETVPDRPVMPTEQFTEKPALDVYQRAARAEIERREGYEIKLRTALEACTAPIKLTNQPETP
jgi:type IV pilus biogenesis protein CpaD/CtpE